MFTVRWTNIISWVQIPWILTLCDTKILLEYYQPPTSVDHSYSSLELCAFRQTKEKEMIRSLALVALVAGAQVSAKAPEPERIIGNGEVVAGML